MLRLVLLPLTLVKVDHREQTAQNALKKWLALFALKKWLALFAPVQI